jgi:fluoroacetyl-CoA thioesterase
VTPAPTISETISETIAVAPGGAPRSGPVSPAALRRRERHRVEAGDLATAWSNDLPVLATPVLVWWAELVAMRAMAAQLPPGWMSVGSAHEVEHAGPSLVGAEVEVVAELVAVEGRRYRFRVTATDDGRVVFRGHHVRGAVERARFVARLNRGSEGARA